MRGGILYRCSFEWNCDSAIKVGPAFGGCPTRCVGEGLHVRRFGERVVGVASAVHARPLQH